MGVAVDQLVVHLAGDVRQVEPTLFFGQAGMEDDLEQQVTQLLLQMRSRAVSASLRSRPDRASRTS